MKRFSMTAAVFLAVFLLNGQHLYAGPQEPAPISGKVVETMDSGGYTYVCLEEHGKKTWVAVPQMKVVKGKRMSFEPGNEM
ncbi:MAG TPA: hypothetical protein VFG09_12830, partial [Thermodesulfovibrionales bacterium]|nr:hypothetical protein [Thermodesulfovibrionales bacterium]